MIRLGELMMILELHRQGLSVTAIVRRTGRDPKAVRKYIERGVEAPAYGPRAAGRPNKLGPFMDFLGERVTAFPDLSAVRLTREIREVGYVGAVSTTRSRARCPSKGWRDGRLRMKAVTVVAAARSAASSSSVAEASSSLSCSSIRSSRRALRSAPGR